MNCLRCDEEVTPSTDTCKYSYKDYWCSRMCWQYSMEDLAYLQEKRRKGHECIFDQDGGFSCRCGKGRGIHPV